MSRPPECPPAYRWLRKLLAPDLPPKSADEIEELFADLYRDAGGSRPRRARVWVLAVADLLRHRLGRWGREAGSRPALDGGGGIGEFVSSLWADARYAVRGLRHRPVLSATVVATLALGVGANTAIFSVVRAALFGPLPFDDVGSLVRLGESDALERGFVATSFPNYMDWSQARSFQGVEGYWAGRTVWLGDGFPELVTVSRVTRGYFGLVGLRPMLGRTFTSEEHQAEARVAILTHGFWVRALGADSAIVGRDVELDTGPIRVVGVMGPDVGPTGVAPFHAELIVPMGKNARPVWTRRARFLHVVARLRPGVDLGEARAEMRALGQELHDRFPDDNPRSVVRVIPLGEAIMGSARTPLLLLWGAVGLVLLITSLNIGTLLLVRAAARSGEFTLRRAVGASRARLLRLAFTEAVVLAILGGAVGTAFGWLALDAFLGLAPAGVPRMDEVRLDGLTLAFTALVTLASTVLFGLAPALAAWRGGGARPGARGGRTPALMRAAVVAEVATALVLVFGSSVFVESLRALTAVDPGYDPAHALAGNVTLPVGRYAGPAERVTFYRQVEERVRALPGIDAAAVAVLPVPATGGFAIGIGVDGALNEHRGSLFRVGPGFFDVHGIEVSRGRAFTAADGPQAPPVAIVSESAARVLFGSGPALGRTVRLTTHLSLGDEPREIVGVVGDARLYGPSEPPPIAVYMPVDQWSSGGVYVSARTAGDPASFLGALRGAIHDVDPLLPLNNLATLEQTLANRYAAPRFYTALLGAFAGLALLLTAAGVFGVLSSTVEQRLREIGVRVALGARRIDVLRWTVRLGMVPTALGVGIGALGLAGLTFLAPRVPELESADPSIVILAAALVVSVTLTTSLFAARRATAVDPISILEAD